MVRDLQCGETVVPDAIDSRVGENLRQRYSFTLDDDFLAQMASCHGGRPRISKFEAANEQWPVGQFLTVLDFKSDLIPPFRPHFNLQDVDERAVESIDYLVDGEHSTSRALFEGLMPFAATNFEMCLDRAYINLLCLDHRADSKQPTVVMWLADEANDAYMDWEDACDFDDEDDGMSSILWDTFLMPVAASFSEFIQSLEE